MKIPLCQKLSWEIIVSLSVFYTFCGHYGGIGKLWIVLYCLGTGYIHHRPLPFVPATTVLDGTKMANTYPANAFAQSVTPFPHIGKFV